MNNLKIRLKFAWNAFNFKPMEYTFPSYKIVDKLRPSECDFSKGYLNGEKAAKYGCSFCNNNSTNCVSRTEIKLVAETEEHLHLCDEHTKIMMAKGD